MNIENEFFLYQKQLNNEKKEEKFHNQINLLLLNDNFNNYINENMWCNFKRYKHYNKTYNIDNNDNNFIENNRKYIYKTK